MMRYQQRLIGTPACAVLLTCLPEGLIQTADHAKPGCENDHGKYEK